MSATAAIATMTAAHSAMHAGRALLNLNCACTLRHSAQHAGRA